VTLYENDKVRERAERLVSQEVRLCVSSLIWEISRDVETYAKVLGCHDDQIQDLCARTVTTYVCDCCAHESEDEDDAEEHAEACPARPWECGACGLEYDTTADAWACCEDLDPTRADAPYTQEETESEAYEHWVVTAWLASYLGAHGEMVCDTNIGWIGGRCTTGQGIAMDDVILQIAAVVLS